MDNASPLALLRHHVTGAINRGEKEPIVCIPANSTATSVEKSTRNISAVTTRTRATGHTRYYLDGIRVSAKKASHMLARADRVSCIYWDATRTADRQHKLLTIGGKA